jgi:hypothetical protein
MNHRFRLLRVLLQPSLLSGSLSLLFAVALVGREGWAYVHREPALYIRLMQQLGLSDLTATYTGNGPSFTSVLFSNAIAYRVLLLLCATGVGLLVYALLRSLGRIVHESSEALDDLRYHGMPHHLTASAPLTRFVLRALSYAGWAVYIVLFFNLIVPFCILLTKDGVAQFVQSALAGGLKVTSAVALLVVSTHVHTIFMRVCFLRLRIFGGLDADLYVSDSK